MPSPNQIDPAYSRQRHYGETDEQYAERMKRLDGREAMLTKFITKQEPDQ